MFLVSEDPSFHICLKFLYFMATADWQDAYSFLYTTGHGAAAFITALHYVYHPTGNPGRESDDSGQLLEEGAYTYARVKENVLISPQVQLLFLLR